ncbi:GGDEF domain-containing protein [Rhodoligotrophos defluvii]|uniref:GGDEF domain-containing protein n=1 Tax=Rhodoligotrophos defluvii TaxID=2561934 RepID=UPI0010C9AEB6|nr:GGDEF domain-containing protein [Rhodoligotrophos defluvii]
MDLQGAVRRAAMYWEWIIRPSVKSRSDLRRYVVGMTSIAIVGALVMDISVHLLFFTTWTAAILSWVVTVATAAGIAIPILFLIGKAHLELWQAKCRVDELSRTDPLTGLLNRRCFFEEQQGPPATKAGMALAIVDIDHFKLINDTYGHRAGDQVLRTVAQIMAAELEDWGKLCRLGGEEFALLTTDVPPDLLVRRLSRVCKRLGSIPILSEGRAIKLTVSIGAAIRLYRSMEELYAEADKALYQAKASGRDRVCLSGDLNALLPPELLEARLTLTAGSGRS